MPSTQIDAAQLCAACKQVDTPAAREVANNADLTALMVDILNGSLAAADGKLAAALGAADKYAAVADHVGKQGGQATVRAVAVSSQLLTQTLGLLKLGSSASPALVVTTVGAMFTKKVALMFGLVENDKQAKIVAAIADLSASGLGVGAAVLGLGTGPVGWVMLVAAVAGAGAAGYKGYATYQEVKAPAR